MSEKKTKKIYQVEVTDEEEEVTQIERPKKEKGKRQLTERQLEGLEIGKQKLREKREQKKQMIEQLKQKENELLEKKLMKKVKKEVKEKEVAKKLDLLTRQIEEISEDEEQPPIRKPQATQRIQRAQPQQEPIKISLTEFMRLKGL